MKQNYTYTNTGIGIKSWTNGVPVEYSAQEQLKNIASLPFIYKHIAVMPDVHMGKGATVGSVIPTQKAIIPAAVGVDIGCGMMAVRTTLTSHDLPESLANLRKQIERDVPVGKGDYGQNVPKPIENFWYGNLQSRFNVIQQKHPIVAPKKSPAVQIGTLGGGNHFIELCLDENDNVWVMLHSGSRNVGNRIGNYFINEAREEMVRMFINLPDKDLAYLAEGSTLFEDYIEAVSWAQDYARANRDMMMDRVLAVLRAAFKDFGTTTEVINCHHNYVERENHFGENVWVTRKGAVRARKNDLGIIPGSMGAKSFIVRGKGNDDSFHSCSHGAGRVMSRSKAKQTFTLDDHKAATAGVECRKDEGVIDETPAAYKDIDAVMAAQSDLVDIVHTLKGVLCIKG